MKIREWELLLLVASVALLMPLFVNWASYCAPFLAVCGVCAGGALIIARTSMSLMQSFRRDDDRDVLEGVVVSHHPSLTEMLGFLNGRQHVRIGGAALPPVPQSPLGAILKPIVDVWESKHHVIVMVVSALYVAMPLDLIPDFIAIFGWIDDAAFLVLFIKHVADCLRREVPPTTRSMEIAIQETKEKEKQELVESIRRN